MSEDARARALAYLARRGWPSADLVEIQGDASTRRYFRAGLGSRSEILLVESEDGAGRLEAFRANARFLEELGLGPPRLIDEAPDLGILALEDLGDVSLRRALEAAGSPAARRRLFAAALDLVADIQGRGTPALGPAVPAFHVRFDAEVFGRELAMFVARWVHDLAGLRLDPADAAQLDAALAWLGQALAALPGVLTHRDYHIDNLHLLEGRLRLIDFQDARWGPAAYDPASLLTDRDVHRFLAPGDTEALLERFTARTGRDPEAFQAEYRLAVVQRSLKAVGTFADQALRRGRRHYLEFIAPSLRRARAAARRVEQLTPVAALIDRAGVS